MFLRLFHTLNVSKYKLKYTYHGGDTLQIAILLNLLGGRNLFTSIVGDVKCFLKNTGMRLAIQF